MSEQEIKVTRQKRDSMVWRLCVHFRLSSAGSYDELSEPLKATFAHFPYWQIVRPLIWHDRTVNQMSRAALSIKYAISEGAVTKHLDAYKKPYLLEALELVNGTE
jgi:hypothetical protein